MDTSTIPGFGLGVRSLVKTMEVAALPDDVWAAWTSNEGITSWWGPAAVNIELRIGGAYEILFSLDPPEGERGSEGCRVLAYVPGESLSFTWNAPPHLPLRSSNTWVVLSFDDAGSGRTAVRLVHTGFLDGPDWDDYMAYFDSAWGYVLDLLRDHWS
ncbi:MAG: SRPBCC domain-containing protein [Acidimicrobiia bacterium]|nr:SRPBCC domain-containing protein [Acidimicrobiia bacterium]